MRMSILLPAMLAVGLAAGWTLGPNLQGTSDFPQQGETELARAPGPAPEPRAFDLPHVPEQPNADGSWGAEPVRVAEAAPVGGPRARRAAPPAGDVFYPGCDAVRAAGAAPLHMGEPGYRPEMDGDGDGVACEPIRHR